MYFQSYPQNQNVTKATLKVKQKCYQSHPQNKNINVSEAKIKLNFKMLQKSPSKSK